MFFNFIMCFKSLLKIWFIIQIQNATSYTLYSFSSSLGRTKWMKTNKLWINFQSSRLGSAKRGMILPWSAFHCTFRSLSSYLLSLMEAAACRSWMNCFWVDGSSASWSMGWALISALGSAVLTVWSWSLTFCFFIGVWPGVTSASTSLSCAWARFLPRVLTYWSAFDWASSCSSESDYGCSRLFLATLRCVAK